MGQEALWILGVEHSIQELKGLLAVYLSAFPRPHTPPKAQI